MRSAVLEARLQETGRRTPGPAAPVEAAIVSWALSEALGSVLKGAPAATTKRPLRFLIGEIRVVARNDIQPTYRFSPGFAGRTRW